MGDLKLVYTQIPEGELFNLYKHRTPANPQPPRNLETQQLHGCMLQAMTLRRVILGLGFREGQWIVDMKMLKLMA